MREQVMDRRTLLFGVGAAAMEMMQPIDGLAQIGGEAVPNTSGTAPPKLKVPPGACDCHHHIYDGRYPFSRPTARMIANARVADYRLLQRRLGLTRSIVVTPAPFPATAMDNFVTLDALTALDPNSRGVAIVYPEVSDAELEALAGRGFRGIRFSLTAADGTSPPIPAATANVIETLSRRVNMLGWHVQFNVDAGQIVAIEDLLNRLPSPLVFDHMGHVPQPQGIAHPAFGIVRRLIDKGRTWVKLSVTYNSSKVGPPTCADVNEVGEAYVKAAPERMVWGSNWPHPNEAAKPDDALLLDLLGQWAPSEATQRRILVENPETLYGFAKSA